MKNNELSNATSEAERKPESNSNPNPNTNPSNAHKAERDALTAIRTTAKFGLGAVVATPAALELMQEKAISPHTLLARHASGDWGDVFAEDRKLNELALEDGSRLFSVYRLVAQEMLAEVLHSKRHELPTVWCITNAANAAGVRDVTTLLLPEDY